MSHLQSSRLMLLVAILCSMVALHSRSAVAADEDGASARSSYIVVLREPEVGGAATERLQVINEYVTATGGEMMFEYATVFSGFAAELSDAAVEALTEDSRVAYIEEDQIAYAAGIQSPVSSWGLDRIDQASPQLDNTYQYSADGTGVNAYILDTGIYAAHSDFGGRVSGGFNHISAESAAWDDCHGHGTHVAGTVAGSSFGVAKNANLFAIRVLDCDGSGPYSVIIAGIDWVAANHVKPAVANLSLGGGPSAAVDNAINNAIAAGVVVVAAAGNSNIDACLTSPARTPDIITVGASSSSDVRASFSNYGTCVDIFAPGVGITSATISSPNSSASWNGTSMAAPHVAGAAAVYLQDNPNALQSDFVAYIENNALLGVLSDVKTGSPNLLLHIPVSVTPEPTPTQTPSPTPTATPELTPTESPELTPTESPELTPTETVSPTPTATPSPTPMDTPEPTPRETPVTQVKTVYVSSTSGGRVNGGRFTDEDILAYDVKNDVWSIFLDGSDVGLGRHWTKDIDAFHILDDGAILLSITGDTIISGFGPVDDSDILRFVPDSLGTASSGTFTLYLDGSTVGLASTGEDIDAIHQLDNGDLLVSTKGRFAVNGLSGKDEDIIRLTRSADGSTFSWSLYFDGSTVGLTTSTEDIFGLWVDESQGEAYFTTKSAFSMPNLNGTGADIFGCAGYDGDASACSFEMKWSGAQHGFASEKIDGISANIDSQTSRMYGIFANAFTLHAAEEEEEVEGVETENDSDDTENEVYLPMRQ